MDPLLPLSALLVLLLASGGVAVARFRRLQRQLHAGEEQRVVLERRLVQRDVSLAHLVDDLPVTLWSTDGDLVVTMARGRGFALVDVDAGALLGLPLSTVLTAGGVDDVDRERGMSAHHRALAGGSVNLQMRILGRTFEVRIVPLRDDREGHVVGTLGVAIDVTERAEVAAVLEEAVDRERDLVEQLRMVDGMKDSFIQAVSHELRTPLTALRGFAVTLQRGEDLLAPDQKAMLLDRIAVNADKLDRLLGDLLDVDRLSRGIIEPRRQRTDVAALVLRILDETDLGDRPLRTRVTPAVVSVDAAKVERIVENLVANALKHTPRGTPLTVGVDADDAGVTIAVEQAGVPVPDELKSEIFEPFRQGPSRQVHAPGTGIGLTLVTRFAELHGGDAWVEDTPDGGAAFRVYLPDHPPLDGVEVHDGAGGSTIRR